MSSRRGWKTPFAGPNNSTQNGIGIGPYYGQPSGNSRDGNTNTRVDQLTHHVGNMSGYYDQDGDRKISRNKFKNQARNNAVKQWGTRGSTMNAPGQPNVVQKCGTSINSASGKPKDFVYQTQTANAKRTNGSGKVNDQRYNRGFDAPPTIITPPPQHGRVWGGRGGFAHVNLGQYSGEDFGCNVGGRQNQSDIDEEDDYLEEDNDDDEFTSDDFDEQFKPLFNMLDKLTVKQLNDPTIEWHCPACHPGPGSSDWYKGLQALMNHTKTTVVRRVKLHRKLAELLGEELNQRGSSVIPVVGAFGKWRGLHETVFDREIVWPPMVVVMNTQLEKDEHGEKWLGMGNQELLDYFHSYEAVKARHSYGPEGHRGMSLLIFESSAMGYLEADRLDNHFADQRIHRRDWEGNKSRFLPGGTRQLYGYIACRADLDYFNKHTQGKAIVKYDMRSYQEMVVVPLKQMNADNQQLISFQNKYFEEQKIVEVLKKSIAMFSQRLKKTIEENRIVGEKTKTQHQQNHKAIDILEGLVKEYTNQFQEVLEQKEREDFEAQSLEERGKVKQSNAYSGTWEDAELRKKRT